MTIEELKRKKLEMGFTNEEVAEMSGVPLGTIQKIFGGATKHPRRKTLEAIEAAFYRHYLFIHNMGAPVLHKEWYSHKSDRDSYPISGESRNGSALREPEHPYGTEAQDGPSLQNRKYTIEDYYALPQERRVELIDGVFYDMAAPTVAHQKVLGLLYYQIETCILSHSMPCQVLFSPCDVQLDNDEYTMVQPDLIVICDEGQIENGKCVKGAPAFVAEILSPSSRRLDLKKKLVKYMEGGVREYWILDPDKENLVIYDFGEDDMPYMTGFTETVPVRISEGKCSVDLAVIHQELLRIMKD